MRFLRSQSIRRQVLLSTVVLLLPLAIGAAWSSNRTRLERRAEVGAEAASIVATSIVYFDQYLRSIDSLASVLVQHPAVAGMIAADSDRLFADVLRDQRLMLNIVLRDAKGTLRGSGLEARAGPNPIEPYVQQAVSSGQPVVSDLIVGPITHRPSVVFVYPVRRADGAVVGVIDFGIDLVNLETAFARIPLPEGSTVTLTDRRGLVLARSREADRYIGTTMEIARAADRDAAPRMSDGKDVNGVDSLFASAVVGRGEWVMTVGIPKSVVGARLWPLYRRNLAIGVVSILTSLMVSLWFGGHLSRQLNQFRMAAGRIAQGDLSPQPRAKVLNRELGELQDSFAIMADRLREAREALAGQVEHERKMREMVESLQQQVVRQERLAAVGVLVSGVAHELNNPLQAIVGAAELLERRSELSPDALREVGLVKVQSGRASEIIRNLSRFGSQQPGPAADIDLRDVIGEVAQLRRSDLLAAQIAFDVQLSPSRKVSANFTEIEQVILNFVINAQQAIQMAGVKDGRVIVRLFDVGTDVRVEVIDNGPGVKPEDESKLFQPFFTTKMVGMGTGLGLSVSYGIIESCGGRIGCERNAFGGATFFFELPALVTPMS